MSNKKLGIITLYGNYNFGNRLQNYAVQQIFRNRGYEVETLVCEKSKVKYYARNIKKTWMYIKGDGVGIRYIQFKKFNRRKIPTRYFFTKNGLYPSSIANEYAFFSVGSDQVWNPELRKNERENFFLRFAQRDQRICVSPSIGVDSIEPKYWADYYNGLQGFPYLSCRESEGAAAISKLVNRPCTHLIDPTLAITSEDWREKFSEPIKENKAYIVMFFLGDIAPVLDENIRKYAQEKRYTVLVPSMPKCKYYGMSPEQFVYMIDHAALVFTDSFHVAAFSVNLNTPFYVFDRHEKLETSNKMNSRIRSLTSLFGLEDRYVNMSFSAFNDRCDFEGANAVLRNERDAFNAYIDTCLSQREMAPYKLPDEACTGCMSCASACPKKCLEMIKDKEGFLRPVLNADECINCGKCVHSCPVLSCEKKKGEQTRSYAAAQIDKSALDISSSGAVFPLICKWILDKGGVVCGAIIDENQIVRHTIAQTLNECSQFYSSKYVQSNIGDCYSLIHSYLKGGRYVLFSGTPCQIEGLRSFLGRTYEKLILVDCVCHGVPSPDVWAKYVEHIKQTYLGGEAIESVNFRDKSLGWENYSLSVRSKNNSYCKSRMEDIYCKGFSTNLFLRRSCHDCPFKGIIRNSDITLGDFWGVDQFLPEAKCAAGTSMIMVHSERGQEIWNDISGLLTTAPFDITKYVERSNKAIVMSVIPNSNRKKFFIAMPSEKIDKVISQFAIAEKRTLIDRVQGRLQRIVKR